MRSSWGVGDGTGIGVSMHGLNLPSAPGRAHMWDARGRGRDEVEKLSAVKHQKMESEYLLHYIYLFCICVKEEECGCGKGQTWKKQRMEVELSRTFS